jgi:hypothetical protein
MRAMHDAMQGDMRAAAYIEKLASRLGEQQAAVEFRGGVLVVPARPETPEALAAYEREVAEQQAPFRGNIGEPQNATEETDGT